MKTVAVDSVNPNSYFSEPVFLDEGFILLSPDVPASRELLERLEKWEYREVMTDGSPVDTPGYLSGPSSRGQALSIEHDIQEQKKINEASRFYGEFQEYTAEFFSAIDKFNTVGVGRLTEMLKQALAQLKTNANVVLRFSRFNIPSESYFIPYVVKTTLLCLAIGGQLRMPAHRLIELGIAAFLHDVGMLRLPPELYLSNRILTAEQKKTIMTHTIVGYKLERSWGLSDDVALGALEHHERNDGSGYPRHLRGEKISTYGKIIALGCSYVASVSHREYKTAVDGHRAIMDIYSRKQYEPAAIKALLYVLSVYPLGSAVLLSNEAAGVVVETNPNNPRTPLVRLLRDPEGNPIEQGVVIPTSQEEGPAIKRTLNPAETRQLLGDEESQASS